MGPIFMLAASVGLFLPQLSTAEARHIFEHLADIKNASASFNVFVSASGHLLQCDVLANEGDVKLGARVCFLLASENHAHGRFVDGTPAAALYKLIITKHIAGATVDKESLKLPVAAPDAILTVTHLPGRKVSEDVGVLVAIDTSGLVTQCAALPDKLLASAPLTAAVCSNLWRLNALPMSDKSGHSIPYVRRMNVRLAVDVP